MSEVKSPSLRKLVSATIVALMIAGILAVVAVLPAEYGIDPLGVGKALGLTDLAAAGAEPVLDLKALAEAPPKPIGNKQLETAPVLTGWNREQKGRYKVDSRKFELEPGGKMEFKYQLRRGSNLVYVWESTGKVKFEFHGEPNAGPEGTYQSYAIDDKVGQVQGSGSFTAPFSGIHGWYWENTEANPVTVTLTSAGFYTNAEIFLKSGHDTLQLEDVK
jgi:hypothetical protein